MVPSFKLISFILSCALLASGCAQLPHTERRAPVTQNSAVEALYLQALEDKYAGRPEQAAARLERAVRIEPSNPHLWFQLAHLADEAGDTSKATGLAQRARSLAGADSLLRRQIDQFLSSLE